MDLLIEKNDKIYPVEIKRAATVKSEWLQDFSVLTKLKKKIGVGAVICLTEQNQYINSQNIAININQI